MDASQHRIALIDLLERDGRVRRSVEVRRWPVVIGRALDCDIVLEDPHVAARHVSLQPDEAGVLHMTVGATRNGVQVGPRTAVEGETCPVPPQGAVWQLGATRLRVRLPDDEVEAERPLGLAATGARPLVTLAAALALWAVVLADRAVDLDPGTVLSDWLLPLFGVPLAVAAWSLAWALGSKLFQHRLEYWAHFAIAVKGGLALWGLDLLLPVVAYALSWDWLSRMAPVALAAVVAGVLYRHATLVVPVPRRWIAAAVGGLLLLAGAVAGTVQMQRTGRLFPQLYLSTLPPPAFRLAPGVTPKELVKDLGAVRERVDAEVRRSAGRDEE